MVSTLITHEYLRTRTWLAVVFGVATLLTVVGTLMAYTPWGFIRVLGFILSFVAVAAFLFVVQLGLAFDYWRSSYSKTGYFTQSLPVKGSTIYGAKFLWGAIVTVVTLLWNVVLAVPVIFGGARAMGDGMTWAALMSNLRSAVGVAPLWTWIFLGFLFVTLSVGGIAQYYFAASLGSESRMNRLGIGGPIIVWFVLYLVMQVLLLVGIVAVPLGLGPGVDGHLAVMSVNYLETLMQNNNPDIMPLGFFPVLFIVSAVLIWRTVVSWNKKVSLA
ncbi:hypothetical protein [Tessaracoccus antarcticus]|uniref:Uncharacterized protein n=1 Tax=Tessaracoccus antarcticus TaxID=2479848 RepID=A0A3M0G732_9ACTN|nr:hypothetical protein [Tessaracoccus antarcticus]RMB59937.1 hypothetical protein EAX62_09410 [Tessaracoccus antarcticus]